MDGTPFNTTRFRIMLAVGGMFFIIFFAMRLRGQTKSNDKEALEAIDRVILAQVEAWNQGKLEELMAGYWNSDDLTFYSGKTITKGWQDTLKRYQKRYQGEGKEMGKLTFKDVTIELLGPEAACVRGRWEVVKSNETPDGLFTLIFKKIRNDWRIIHDHTSSAE